MSDMLDEETDTEMDCQLRRCFAALPPPEVSSHFDQRLRKRLQPPPRLSRNGRVLLGLYALAALVISVWLMRRESIGWPLLIMAVIAPITVIYLVNCLRLLRCWDQMMTVRTQTKN
jgi:hypothetical protein